MQSLLSLVGFPDVALTFFTNKPLCISVFVPGYSGGTVFAFDDASLCRTINAIG
jgi:hypothetical protein